MQNNPTSSLHTSCVHLNKNFLHICATIKIHKPNKEQNAYTKLTIAELVTLLMLRSLLHKRVSVYHALH